jgi:hypothetical protein
MRKRSKYRPKGVRLDTMDYVMTSIKPLATLTSEVATLRIKNHGALTAVCQGRAGRTDIDMLVAALNIAEALAIQGVGTDYAVKIRAGQDALRDMAQRGVNLGDKFILRGPELQALNIAEALAIQGVGTDYAVKIRAGQDALRDMAQRGVNLGDKFILRGPELQALNLAIEVHDAQLDAITMQQLERAIDYVTRVIRAGGARAIK